MIDNLKVLIADDSDLMRMILKKFLSKFLQSPNVSEAGNLADAFSLLKENKFDLLILDINMPKGDSTPETVVEVLKIQPNIKVCMFTGNDKATLEEVYINAGAIGFIEKNDDIGASIEKMLKRIYS